LLSDDEVDSFVDIKKFNLLRGKEISKGEIGCYKSHLLAWNAFLSSSAQFALICEDDISFNARQLEGAVKNLTEKENIAFWDICAFQLKHSGLPIAVKKINNQSNLVVYAGHCVEAGCYLLNRKTAFLLAENATKMVMPLDYYYNRPFEFGVKFMGVEPRLVGQTFGTSEIGETKSKIKKITDRRVRLYKKLYRFASAVVRILYNLSVYLRIKTIIFVKKIEKIKNNLKNIF
jgi:glycosyl transferase family 25